MKLEEHNFEKIKMVTDHISLPSAQAVAKNYGEEGARVCFSYQVTFLSPFDHERIAEQMFLCASGGLLLNNPEPDDRIDAIFLFENKYRKKSEYPSTKIFSTSNVCGLFFADTSATRNCVDLQSDLEYLVTTTTQYLSWAGSLPRFALPGYNNFTEIANQGSAYQEAVQDAFGRLGGEEYPCEILRCTKRLPASFYL